MPKDNVQENMRFHKNRLFSKKMLSKLYTGQ